MDSSALQTLNFYQRLQFELEVEKLVVQNRELQRANDELKQKLTTACKNPFKDNLSFEFKQIYQMEIQRLNNCLENEKKLSKTWRFAFYQLARQMDPGADHARNSLVFAKALVLLEEAMNKIEFYEKNYTSKIIPNDLNQKDSINEQLPLLSPSIRSVNPKSSDYPGAQTFFSKLKQQTGDTNDTKLFNPIDAKCLGEQFDELIKSDRDEHASTDAAMTDVTNEDFNYSNSVIGDTIKVCSNDDDFPNSNICSPLNYLNIDTKHTESLDYDPNDTAVNASLDDEYANDSDNNFSPQTFPINNLNTMDSPITQHKEIANPHLKFLDDTTSAEDEDENSQTNSPKDVSTISEHMNSDALFLIESSPHLKHLSAKVQQNISKVNN